MVKFQGPKSIIHLRNEVYMWYENIDNVIFLKKLYNQIPELLNVKIDKISLTEEGRKVVIVFDMPNFVDNIPEKWNNLGYNSLCIELNFWNINDFQMSYDNSFMVGNISIVKENGSIHVFVNGNVNCQFKAEDAMIQKVMGYINTDKENASLSNTKN